MTETLIATAVGSGAAALVGKLLWERWRAPERLAERVEGRYVMRTECERCLAGTTQRVSTVETAIETIRRENREDHTRMFSRLDQIADTLRRNGTRGG